MISCEVEKCLHNDDGLCRIHKDSIEINSEGMCEDILVNDALLK